MKFYWGNIFGFFSVCSAIQAHPGGELEHQEATIVKLKNNIHSMESLLSRQERRLVVGFEYLKKKIVSMNKMANQAEKDFHKNHRSDINCTVPSSPPNGHILGVHFDTNGALLPLTQEIYFVCDEGFHLSGSEVRSCQENGTWSGEMTSCEDITPRLKACAKLNCLNEGVCSKDENSNAIYRCQCPHGFYGKRCQKERSRVKGQVKQTKCTNRGENINCSCDNGYKKGLNNALCFDIDECADNNHPQTDVIPDDVGFTKRNTVSRHNQLCRHQCMNTPGSYKCICPQGYIVDVTNQRECVDVDECSLETHSCNEEQQCFNTGGSFQCVTVTCPKNYKKISTFICQRRKCAKIDKKCRREPVTYTFSYIDLPSSIAYPADIFQLQADQGSAVNVNKFAIGIGNEPKIFIAKKQDKLHGTLIMTQPLQNVTSWQVDFEVREVTLGKRRSLIGRYVHRILIFLSPFDF